MKRVRDIAVSTRCDIRRYMISPANADTNYVPDLLWELLAGPVMAAVGRVHFKTLLALALTCKTLFDKHHWQQHAVLLGGDRHWDPKYFLQFAPYVVEFHYALPCHHGREFVDLAACSRLTTLALYGNKCYTDGWYTPEEDGFFPTTLTHLMLHNYKKNDIHRRALDAIPVGQLCVTECSGPACHCENEPIWKGRLYTGFRVDRCKCLQKTE